jgi:RHS repeat-associated protein
VSGAGRDAGAWVEHYKYTAFGGLMEGDATLTRYLYTGREFDVATHLQYNRERWEDSSTGRFLSEDPEGFASGDTNLYRYAWNSPTNGRDPTGTSGWGIVGSFFQGVVDKGISYSPAGALARAAISGDYKGIAHVLAPGTAIVDQILADPTSVATLLSPGLAVTGPLAKGDYDHAAYGAGGLVVDAGAAFALTVVPLSESAPRGIATGTYPEGTFSITQQGWHGYPEGVPRPGGPFRILVGAEYDAARAAADASNNAARVQYELRGSGLEIHEIQPVKFGGSPIDPRNKMLLEQQYHRRVVTPWWNSLRRQIERTP